MPQGATTHDLASRLEGMTRQLRVPILMDESLAAIARDRLPATAGRMRRLARRLDQRVRSRMRIVLVPVVGERELGAPDLHGGEIAARIGPKRSIICARMAA